MATGTEEEGKLEINPVTALSFSVPNPSIVSLVVYDVLGQKIAEPANGYREAGNHTATWNGVDQASRVYFAGLTVTAATGQIICTKVNKLLLMK